MKKILIILLVLFFSQLVYADEWVEICESEAGDIYYINESSIEKMTEYSINTIRVEVKHFLNDYQRKEVSRKIIDVSIYYDPIAWEPGEWHLSEKLADVINIETSIETFSFDYENKKYRINKYVYFNPDQSFFEAIYQPKNPQWERFSSSTVFQALMDHCYEYLFE